MGRDVSDRLPEVNVPERNCVDDDKIMSDVPTGRFLNLILIIAARWWNAREVFHDAHIGMTVFISSFSSTVCEL